MPLIDRRTSVFCPCMYSGNALESTLHIQDYTLYVELLHPEFKKKIHRVMEQIFFKHLMDFFAIL